MYKKNQTIRIENLCVFLIDLLDLSELYNSLIDNFRSKATQKFLRKCLKK